MTIDFVGKPLERKPQLTPSLQFTADDGYHDCCIYLDHVAVAYFDNTNGGIRLLPIEVGPGFHDGGQTDDLQYLQDRGVEFDKRPHPWGHADTWEYYIKVSK